jgi:amino acid transporter
MALKTAGVFTLGLAVLIPIGLGGTVGDPQIASDPASVYVRAFEQVVGPAASVVTIVLAASLLLIMNSATADAGRALYGIAAADMTIKQLHHLNKNGTPSRAILVSMVINIGLLLFVGDVLGIIFASNLGYIAAVFFVLSGFLLLRKDRPQWPRPLKLSRAWVPIAFVLAGFNLVLLVVGGLSPADTGYGGLTEQLVGVGVLVLSFVLFLYRRLIQDRGSLRLQEEVPLTPQEEDARPRNEPVLEL